MCALALLFPKWSECDPDLREEMRLFPSCFCSSECVEKDQWSSDFHNEVDDVTQMVVNFYLLIILGLHFPFLSMAQLLIRNDLDNAFFKAWTQSAEIYSRALLYELGCIMPFHIPTPIFEQSALFNLLINEVFAIAQTLITYCYVLQRK